MHATYSEYKSLEINVLLWLTYFLLKNIRLVSLRIFNSKMRKIIFNWGKNKAMRNIILESKRQRNNYPKHRNNNL